MTFTMDFGSIVDYLFQSNMYDKAQADIINDYISINPEWLYDEEHTYSKRCFEI